MRAWLVVAIALAACSEKQRAAPVPIAAKVSVLADELGERVAVEVTTLPGASVSLRETGALSGSSAVADPAGKATLVVGINPSGPASVELELRAHPARSDAAYFPGLRKLTATRAASLAAAHDGRGSLSCRLKDCRVRLGEGAIVVESREPGLVVEVAGKRAPVRNGRAEAPLDVEAIAGGLTLADVFGRRDDVVRSIEFALHWQDGTTTQGVLPYRVPQLRADVVRLLSRAASGPVELRHEGTGRGVLTASSDSTGHVRGAARLGDIGYVALEGEVVRRESCGTYRGEDGRTLELSRVLRDRRVRLFERRTGRLLGEKVFAAPDVPCPRSTVGGIAESTADSGVGEAWIATLTP